MHELHRPCRIFPDSVYHLINHEKNRSYASAFRLPISYLKHKHYIAAQLDEYIDLPITHDNGLAFNQFQSHSSI